MRNILSSRWLPLLFWMGAIFLTSSQPAEDLPNWGVWDLLLKKSGHFFAYAILAVLAHRVTAATERPLVWAFIITLLYAGSDEFHQLFVDGRHGSFIDILIDSLGALAGLFLVYRLQPVTGNP